MPRTYQHFPRYPHQEMSQENEIPFEMILSGTQEAYMKIKCNDANNDGRANSSSNRTYKFRILPCKKDRNCLFNVLFEYLKGVKSKSSSQKSSSRHGDGDIHKAWAKFLEMLATKYGSSTGAHSSSGFCHHGVCKSDEMVKSVDGEKGGEKVCERCFSVMSCQEGLKASKEIYAAMEYFDFSVTLVKQSDKSRRYFHIFHLDDEESDVFSQRSRAHILFTGDAERGHFQLLEPAEEGPYCITSMTYKVDDYNVQDKIFSLVPSMLNETENDSLFGSVVKFCKNLFKRKLPDPSDDIDEISLHKRTKRDNPNPDAAIQRANLNPHECTLIIQSYAEKVTKLRSEFEKEGKNSTEIFPGVLKSRVLTVENVNTAFIRFCPKSWTEFSLSSFDTNFMIQRGGCITLRTITMGPCKIEHENEPIVQTEPFLIPQGIQYALQNDSERKTVLLRIFWHCAS